MYYSPIVHAPGIGLKLKIMLRRVVVKSQYHEIWTGSKHCETSNAYDIHMTEEAWIGNTLGGKSKAPTTVTFTVHALYCLYKQVHHIIDAVPR